MSIAIKAENISKAYRLGEIGTGTISRDIERWFAKIRGKEDPFLRLGEVNDRAVKGSSDIIWSLKDIDFEIEKGDAVGIIGRNGAGKSTLLKILSRITSPTTGRVLGNGRIASLLEVGTGFNPELTGRENIFLNGTILGMRKAEVKLHFDAIVDFAGVARYIDTPVKRYSSGMYVRLAFAVAAYLESEILIVDEVLAVGDAEFQKKCLGKMGEVSKKDGKTVLFVSHNLQAVRNLCTRGIVLEKGENTFTGNVHDAINWYYHSSKKNQVVVNWEEGYFSDPIVNIERITIRSGDNPVFTTDSQLEVEIISNIKKDQANILMDLCLYNADGVLVFDVVSLPRDFAINRYNTTCIIPANFLNTGDYTLTLLVVQNHSSALFTLNNVLSFEVEEGQREIEYYSAWPGVIRPRLEWKINEETGKKSV